MGPLEIGVVAAVGTFLATAGVGMAIAMLSSESREGNPRLHRARQRRRRAEERADSEAKLTSEVLGSSDALADEVTDMRQRVRSEALIEQRQRERDRLAGGTPTAGAVGGPPDPPPHP